MEQENYFGSPCESNITCYSGLCLNSGGEKKCTVGCAEYECPEDLFCAPFDPGKASEATICLF